MGQAKSNHCMVVHARYPLGEPRVEREADTLIGEGFNVEVICLRHPGEPEFEVIDGIKVYRLPVRRHKDRGVIVQFFEYLAFFGLALFRLILSARRYQVIQLHGPPDFLVFAALLPKLLGAKIILDIHDLMPEFYLARFNSQKQSIFVKILLLQEKLACKFADHVITVTEPWRQTLICRGVPADKCSVVMNVPGQRFARGSELSENNRQTSSFAELKLIYHGNITYRYGLDLVLKALIRILDKAPQVKLIIHGRGDYLDELKTLVRQFKLDEHVQITTNFIPTEELPALIRSAHLGLVPYRNDVFTDGILPTKLLEYTRLGLPAIAARTSGISAYFDEDMVKFFAPENVEDLAKAIESVYFHREQLDELAHNLDRFNRIYNWDNQAVNYVNLIKNLSGGT